MSDLQEIKAQYYVIILNQGETANDVWEKFSDYAEDNDVEKLTEHIIPIFVNEMVKEKYNRDCMMISLVGGLSTVINMIQELNPKWGRHINGLFTMNHGSMTVIDIS